MGLTDLVLQNPVAVGVGIGLAAAGEAAGIPVMSTISGVFQDLIAAVLSWLIDTVGGGLVDGIVDGITFW